MNRLGLIAALQPEIQSILDNELFGWEPLEKNFYKSAKFDIYLAISGIGKAFAVYALSKFIDKVDTVFTVGTSGGLSDERIGSVYVSTEFVEHDMDASGLGFPKGITPFSEINKVVLGNYSNSTVERIQRSCSNAGVEINLGRTISGDQFLSNPKSSQEKRNAFQANLVDMESAAIAKICVLENKEILALRYISDNANHDAKVDWNESVKNSSSIFNRILSNLYL